MSSPSAPEASSSSRINLFLLTLCQLISTSGTVTMVTLAGILGSQMAPSLEWSTVPVTASILGTAAATVPAALSMRRWGRRAVFSAAAAVAASGALLAAYAIVGRSFGLFTLACLLIGSHLAFVLQYRFAAAESVSPQRVGMAVSLVLLGSIGGAFVSPWVVLEGKELISGAPYAGTLLMVAGLYSLAALLLLGLRRVAVHGESAQELPPRPLREILAQPACRLAIFSSLVAYGVMTLVMTATPLSMHVVDGFDMAATGAVIRGHVLGMYLPSLLTGLLIARLGVGRMMGLGGLVFLVTIAVAASGHRAAHYHWALVLLGIGWNLLFIGGTTLLTRTYRPNERFRVQAVNEFSTFGASALASLVAGGLIHSAGWITVALAPLPLVSLVLVGIFLLRRDELVRQ